MKKLIFLFFALSQILSSQTYEPAQYKFHWGTNGPEVYISSDSLYFTQTKFLLGWHWGAGRKISQALDVNQIHGGRIADTSQVVNNCMNTANPDYYLHDFDLGIMNARGLQYEPTLSLDKNNLTNTNIYRPNNFLGADNSASKKFFVQLIKFA